MLYDEEGKAFVEPPLIPEEQNLLYIVKDYRRMYGEYSSMQARIKRLQETNIQLSNRNFSQQRYIFKLKEIIKHCVKWMKKKNVERSPHLDNFLKENKL
jgi:hypothetical protein